MGKEDQRSNSGWAHPRNQADGVCKLDVLNDISALQVVYGASHTSVLFIALECKTQDMGPFRLAIVSRTEKPGPSVSLDLIFDQYTEFTLVPLDATLQPCNQSSGFSVHLTGYHMPIEEGVHP